MAVQIMYRLGWYDLLSVPWVLTRTLERIREFGAGKWIASLGLFGITAYALWVSASIPYMIQATCLVVIRAITSPRYFMQSFFLLVIMVVAFDRIQLLHKSMRASIIGVFAPGRESRIDNIMLWSSGAPLIWWPGRITLVLTVGYFATMEELNFRQIPNDFTQMILPPGVVELFVRYPLLGVLVWSMLIFGLVHLYSGVRIGDALVLGLVGGAWFAWQFFVADIDGASVAHANYNYLAITYMIWPRFQRAVNGAINAVLVEFGRHPLHRSPWERINSLTVMRAPSRARAS